MLIKAAKCKLCNDIIYSRTRHDYRTCSCGNLSIDGGQQDYIKIDFASNNPDDFEFLDLELDVTLQQLYDDWNCYNKDKYGLIKSSEK